MLSDDESNNDTDLDRPSMMVGGDAAAHTSPVLRAIQEDEDEEPEDDDLGEEEDDPNCASPDESGGDHTRDVSTESFPQFFFLI